MFGIITKKKVLSIIEQEMHGYEVIRNMALEWNDREMFNRTNIQYGVAKHIKEIVEEELA